jgi:hypothetical protein
MCARPTLCPPAAGQADLMPGSQAPGRPYVRKKPKTENENENQNTKNARKTEKPPGARSSGQSPSPSSQLARSQEALLRAKQAADARSGRPVASGCAAGAAGARRSGCGQLWLAAAGQAREVGRGQLSGTCTHLLLLWPPGMLSLRTCCCICVDRPALLLLVE